MQPPSSGPLADKLNLSVAVAGCLLGDSGAEAIAYALAGNKKLETLELPGESAHVVCSHFSSNPLVELTVCFMNCRQ